MGQAAHNYLKVKSIYSHWSLRLSLYSNGDSKISGLFSNCASTLKSSYLVTVSIQSLHVVKIPPDFCFSQVVPCFRF